ncbi:MAG: hypothetical protein LBC20_00560, partial [Planctomycetaceae bacterium]|nr:hypothetical protein [Planctomycetaceae bacterium]
MKIAPLRGENRKTNIPLKYYEFLFFYLKILSILLILSKNENRIVKCDEHIYFKLLLQKIADNFVMWSQRTIRLYTT